jgi:outer membrane protein assembly factor BamE (lipoprotein component of BamABCDE complex)
MKTKFFTIPILLFAGFVSACVSVGHEVDQSKVDQIQKGVTTKAQVREWLGEPEQVTKSDSGDETWMYSYLHSSAKAQNFIPYVGLFVGGSNTENQNTVVVFGSDGIVKSLTTSYGGTSADTNLGAGGAPKTP